MENSILIHNIAGELASKYVCYLAKMSMGHGLSHKYFKENWIKEYNRRSSLMEEDNSLIDVLNGYNEYFACNINQKADIKIQFYYLK